MCVCKIRVLGNKKSTQNSNSIHGYLGATNKMGIDNVI